MDHVKREDYRLIQNALNQLRRTNSEPGRQELYRQRLIELDEEARQARLRMTSQPVRPSEARTDSNRLVTLPVFDVASGPRPVAGNGPPPKRIGITFAADELDSIISLVQLTTEATPGLSFADWAHSNPEALKDLQVLEVRLEEASNQLALAERTQYVPPEALADVSLGACTVCTIQLIDSPAPVLADAPFADPNRPDRWDNR